MLIPVRDLAPALSCSLNGRDCTNRTPDGIPYGGDEQPPFYGGQMPGVPYQIRVFSDRFNMSNDQPFSSGDDTNWRGPYTGPISRIWTPEKEQVPSTASSIFAIANGVQVTVFSSADTLRYRVIRSISVRRADLQPDTGGNPRPIVGLPPNPSRSPVVANPREIAPGQPNAQPANYPQTRPITSPSSPNPQQSPYTPQLIAAPAPNPQSQPLTNIPGNAPIAPPVENPPPPQPEPPGSPGGGGGGSLPWWLPGLALGGLVAASPISRLNGGQATPGGGRVGLGTSPTSPTCSYDGLGISGKVDLTNSVLNSIQTVQLAAMQSMLSQINTKLGPQVEGGISGYLKKFWQWFHIDRIINLLTLWTTIHNAYMLSNGIAQTLFSSFDMVFQIFGFSLKDDEGNDIDTGNWIGNQFNEFFSSVFGAENVEEFRYQWNRYNRIYQAAANIVNAVQSIMYSVLEALEVVGNYVAWIGNAAKKYGVVVERAYNWMNPNLNFRQNRFFQRLQQVQEAVETVEIVAGEVLNITEMVDEIGRQSEELKNLIQDKEREVQDQHDAGRRESIPPLAPRIAESDETPPTETE
ncbi:hypothetical protein [Egbenema bharatensis]|uniref:hypothetical protein n=1 Tax=Egbenema bharatensis TaxID=3463334 RepID=UPI003A8B6511